MSGDDPDQLISVVDIRSLDYQTNNSIMKLFEASFSTVLIRFYLMMAVVLIGFTTGYYYLAFLAVPLFMSAIMGIKFTSDDKSSAQSTVKVLSNAISRRSKRAA